VPDYEVPRDKRARTKAMIGELRRARGWPVERLAAHPRVRISAKVLQEYERPGGRCPSRVLVAALAYALEAPELAQLLLPPGWAIVLVAVAEDEATPTPGRTTPTPGRTTPTPGRTTP
jgi:hypothetical protein